MDREALELRNQAMSMAFHTVSLKHRLRREVLSLAAKIPIPSPRKQNHRRILIIRPDHLGDVLLSRPAIWALKAARPDVDIHMLVGPWSADVAAAFPEVEQIITLGFPGFTRAEKDDIPSPYRLAVSSALHLRRIGYGSAIILRPDHWWGGLIAKLAGIPERIGYALPDTKPYLTHATPFQHEHVILQNLRLVEQWTGEVNIERVRYEYPVDIVDEAFIDGTLHERGLSLNQPIFCIHPGSGTWAKQWQDQSWATVADTLTEQIDAHVVFTGGSSELPLIRRITAQMKKGHVIVAGETRIGQLSALFKRARIVLGPDSGPLHLAAAVGTPTVTLFGPADPIEFGPWGDPQKHLLLTSDIKCRPCRILDWSDDNPEYHPCVREISVGRVLDAARRAINTR